MSSVTRSPGLALFFAVLAGAGACGDDPSGGGSGDRDGLFDEPADFERGDCGGELDGIDPGGIWHIDMDFGDSANSAAAVRIDPEGDAGFVAFLFGTETDDVRLSADDLFVRREVSVNGEDDVVAIDLCRVDGDGVLTGEIASCSGDDCVVGAVAAHPVAPIDEPEAENMTVVSEWSGSPEWDTGEVTINVRHHGDLAYVVRSSDGLRIVDLTDPAQPVDLGHLPPRFPADEYYNDVKISEADGRIYAFLASNLRGVVAADITDPSDPVEVGTFPAAPIGGGEVRVHTLFIEGDRLYAATTSLGALQIFDIAAPADGVAQLGQFVHPDIGTFGGFVHDLSVQDGIAYLNYWNLGFIAVDAGADPSAPAVVGAFADYPRRTSHSNWVTEVGGRRIAVHGDEDFDAHVRIVDVDPESATAFEEIGSYQTRAPVSVHNIMAVGELALVTYYQDGLRVLDLADPTSPVEVAHFASWPGAEAGYGRSFYEGAIGVDHDPERDLILLADTHRGLIVLTLDR